MHDLEKDVSYPMIPNVCMFFACQFSVMEMKIVTTEAGAFGPIFSPGHF